MAFLEQAHEVAFEASARSLQRSRQVDGALQPAALAGSQCEDLEQPSHLAQRFLRLVLEADLQQHLLRHTTDLGARVELARSGLQARVTPAVFLSVLLELVQQHRLANPS